MTDDDPIWTTFVHLAHAYGVDKAHSLTTETHGAERANQYHSRFINEARKIQTGYPPNIVAGPVGQGWYAGPLGGRYWPKLFEHLRTTGHLSDEALEKLDSTTSKIIAYTPDPSKPSWRSLGLVVGYVQSGKTTNFTGVIAKAVDVGYNLVIVLTGIHEGLRKQTQGRLEAQLCDLDREGWKPVTTVESDFRRPPMPLESLLPTAGIGAALMVVKKNAAVLRKVHRWIADAERKGGLVKVKALIIDDEADQASIQTKRINPLIYKLIERFPRVTYIGYTATPFANVLDDLDSDTSLYPRSFILNLPRPDGYFGAESIFGRDELPEDGEEGPIDGYDMVRTVPSDDATALVPRRGQPFDPQMTDSLASAIRWFVLATATRRVRGDTGHSTMLVHTSMRTDAHMALQDPVRSQLAWLKGRIEAGDEVVIEELRRLWDKETSAVPASEWGLLKPSFNDVMAEVPSVLSDTRVILDNCRSTDRLDYSSGPVTAIAIGGNTLSRGLTLEGLVVSYFVRAAKAYDTLLQMGRWFGFRHGYEDLPRIYMTDDLKDWFRHLSTVEHEVRKDIEFLETQSLTPTDFAVRVRTHPALLVTAKLGNNVRQAYVSYGGRRVQVRYFKHLDADWLAANLNAASALVAAVDSESGVQVEERSDGSVVWRDVPVGHVVSFLDAYQVHEDSPDLDRALLRKYIEKEVANGSLTRWSVAVLGLKSPERGTVQLGNRTFGRIIRSRLADNNPERADIKTLGSKEDRVTDMLPLPGVSRRTSEARLAQLRQEHPVYRTRGLLILYPIDPESPPKPSERGERETRAPLGAVTDVIGLALVFPGNAARSVQQSYIAADLSTAEPIEEPEDVEDVVEGDDGDTGADR